MFTATPPSPAESGLLRSSRYSRDPDNSDFYAQCMGCKLGGSLVQSWWLREHLGGLHYRSQPDLCTCLAAMAWKRSGFESPKLHSKSPSQDRFG